MNCTYTLIQHGNAFSFVSRLTQNGKTIGSDAVTCDLGAKCLGVFKLNGEGDSSEQVAEKATNNKIFYPGIIGDTKTFRTPTGTSSS